jgi:hypothetical protein
VARQLFFRSAPVRRSCLFTPLKISSLYTDWATSVKCMTLFTMKFPFCFCSAMGFGTYGSFLWLCDRRHALSRRVSSGIELLAVSGTTEPLLIFVFNVCETRSRGEHCACHYLVNPPFLLLFKIKTLIQSAGEGRSYFLLRSRCLFPCPTVLVPCA